VVITRSRRVPVTFVVLALLGACTGSNPPAAAPSGSSPSAAPTSASATPSPTTFLADGTPLPSGCEDRSPARSQTVAFAADGRIWALDPRSGRLSCLVESTDPGPFLWGPRGDRVLLNDFQVAGWRTAPSSAPSGVQPAIADWGHPVGIAIVFARADAKHPQKFFLASDRTTTLRDLPAASYLDVAYHPPGLALAFILQRKGSQSIWFSTNEGEQAKQLVFTEEGTTFSDVTFTHDGESLVYIAHHAQGYSELHTIDLARPNTLNSVWKGPVGEYARTVAPSPDDRAFAVTEGKSCSKGRAAMLLGHRRERRLVPSAGRPSSVLGWLDPQTVLVGVGGCGAPMDLYQVPATGASGPSLLVRGVIAAASRTPAPSGHVSLPKEVELDTGSGIG
jgi:hypothetical protein